MLSWFDGSHKQQIRFIALPQFRIKFQSFEVTALIKSDGILTIYINLGTDTILTNPDSLKFGANEIFQMSSVSEIRNLASLGKQVSVKESQTNLASY